MSEKRSEDSELYSEAYSIGEMQEAVREIADLQTPSPRWKERVTAASRALGFSWSRTKDFYYRNARTVLDHEGRAARAILREIKARKQAHAQAARLYETLAYLRAADADFHSASIDRLERQLAEAGVLGGTVDQGEE